MKDKFASFAKKTGEKIEEIILICIILLNIFDFTEQLSPDIDYIKKIISWTGLGYLLYKASITDILFGTKDRKTDIMLIIAYFSLSFKNMIAYAKSTIAHLMKQPVQSWWILNPIDKIPQGATIINMQSIDNTIDLARSNMTSLSVMQGFEPVADKLTLIGFRPNDVILNISNNISSKAYLVDSQHHIHRWLNYFIMNQPELTNVTLLAGLMILALISVYCASAFKIRAHSVMGAIFGAAQKQKKDKRPPILKIFAIFLVLNFFFVVIFNLMMEWLAIAIDAPLLVTALFFYLLVWIKHHKKFSTGGIIYRLGNLGEDFYTGFVSLLKSRKGILLGVSGMLVLHIITEIGIFMIPYTIGISDSLYMDQPEFNTNHEPIFSYTDITGPKKGLYANDVKRLDSPADIIAVTYVYIMNHITMLSLLIMPAMIWYSLFRKRKPHLNRWMTTLFFAGLTCFMISPVFRIERIDIDQIAGVDIQTQSFLDTSSAGAGKTMLISVISGLAVYIAYGWKRKRIQHIAFTISTMYFTYYILLYFMDLSTSYTGFISKMISINNYILAFYLGIIFMINIIFYTVGFASYLYAFIRN